MIGFDRPLRPEWIYKTLRMVETGHAPGEYNLPFETIAAELVGKEGKRKARTVLFRSFIYSLQESRTTIENNQLIELSRQQSLSYLQPIYLIKLMMDYEITRFIINKMDLLFDASQQISTAILTRKMVQEYGDRDVVRRSVRSFLKTLAHFGILAEAEGQSMKIIAQPALSVEQMRDILKLYHHYFLKSGIIDLNHLEQSLFKLFTPPKLDTVANRYHGVEWEYVRDVHRAMLIFR